MALSSVSIPAANDPTADPLFTAFGKVNAAIAAANAGALHGFKNRLINGDFRLNQRVAGAAAADNTYGFDRWKTLTQTGTITLSQLTDAEAGTPTAIRLTQAQASAQRMGQMQWIESANCRDLRGRGAVVSGRVRCSAATNIRYAVIEWTGTADAPVADPVLDWTSVSYTPGGFFTATTLNVLATGVVATTANTWRDLTDLAVTVGASANNLGVVLWTESTQAQNVTLDFGRLQIEPGAVSTAFELRPIQAELALCQRYYQKSYAYATAPGAATATGVTVVPLNGNASTLYSSATVSLVPKRATPTVTAYDNAGNASRVTDFTGGGLSQTDNRNTILNITASTDSFRLINTQSGTTFSTFHWTADAEL